MIEITADEILSELLLLTSTVDAAGFLLVEGNGDERLFRQLVKDRECVYIIPAGSQTAVIDAIQALSSDHDLISKLKPTKGVIDRDYLAPLHKLPSNPDILTTDLRDIECMMVNSDVFHSIVAEFVDWNKAKKFKIHNADDLRAALIDVCSAVGALRFWSQASNKNISFKHLDLSKCLIFGNTKLVNLDHQGLITRLQGAQTGKSVGVSDFLEAQKLCEAEKYFSTPLLLCRGHDLTVVLASVLRKCCGNGAARTIDQEEVERLMRVGFPRFWQSYSLISGLREWLVQIGLGPKLA